jgi:uncharacterized protein with NRDE domain
MSFQKQINKFIVKKQAEKFSSRSELHGTSWPESVLIISGSELDRVGKKHTLVGKSKKSKIS